MYRNLTLFEDLFNSDCPETENIKSLNKLKEFSRNINVRKSDKKGQVNKTVNFYNPNEKKAMMPYRYRNQKPSLVFKETKSSQYYADRKTRKNIPDNTRQYLQVRNIQMERDGKNANSLSKMKSEDLSLMDIACSNLKRNKTMNYQSSKLNPMKDIPSSVSTLRIRAILRGTTQESESEIMQYKFFDQKKFVIAIKPSSKMIRLIKSQNQIESNLRK